jgi:hypothetical protein
LFFEDRKTFNTQVHSYFSEGETMPKKDKCRTISCQGTGGAIYGLGVIGAAVYYIQNATGFWSGVLGVLKALVWPAFLVYRLLGG